MVAYSFFKTAPTVIGLSMVLALGCETEPDSRFDPSGTGGAAGSGGSDGDAGSPGVGGTGGGMEGEACIPATGECEIAQTEPVEEMCEVILPDQPSACSGSESTENPKSCTASGNTVKHKLTEMQSAADCNVGFDLDGCDGRTCNPRVLGYDGANGVDNALSLLHGVSLERGGSSIDLGIFDQVLHEAICTGAIDLEVEVDAVPVQRCAVVRLSSAGTTSDPIPMNLSDDGCLSGTIGTIPIGLGSAQHAIENAVVRMTVSPRGFSDGVLGGTVRGSTADAIAEAVATGLSAIISQLYDINADLAGNSQEPCDAFSMTLRIGGSAIP